MTEDQKISQASDQRETPIPLQADGEETGDGSANLRKAESVHPMFVKHPAHWQKKGRIRRRGPVEVRTSFL